MTDQEFLKALCTPRSSPDIKSKILEVCKAKDFNEKMIKGELLIPLSRFVETKEVKQLKDASSFKKNAELMSQNVNHYIGATINGYFIYHITTGNQHGTMIVDNCGKILSLFGPNNSIPSSVGVLIAIAKWLGVNKHDFVKSGEYIKYISQMCDEIRDRCINIWAAYMFENWS